MTSASLARMPVVFIGHGSPSNALQDNVFTRAWGVLGQRLPRPRAILSISAHWETKGIMVTAAPRQRTIHDFGAFMPALFEIEYNPPGDPELAKTIAAMLAPYGRADADSWGLDHGTWSVLKFMYPAQDVPTLQLSMDYRLEPKSHYSIGQALRPLRDQGVLILGSGQIVHNLMLFDRRPDAVSPPWVAQFSDAVKARIVAGDDQAVIDYRAIPDASKAVPDPDHFHPLLYALGARTPGEPTEFLTDQTLSTLSMTSVLFGAGPS